MTLTRKHRTQEWKGLIGGRSTVRVEGERGEFTFMQHTSTEHGHEYVTVYGPGENGKYRTLPPERITPA